MPTPTTCSHCGQTDDHPKVHLGEDTRHHDCLSVTQERALRDSAQPAGSGPKASAVIDACKDGVKGDELRALILDPTALAQAEGLHETAAQAEEG